MFLGLSVAGPQGLSEAYISTVFGKFCYGMVSVLSEKFEVWLETPQNELETAQTVLLIEKRMPTIS